jgi:hypothetical protein
MYSYLIEHLFVRQDWLSIFTADNPAGNVTTRDVYFRTLITLIVVGVAVSVKRVWLGYYFGRRICGMLQYLIDCRPLILCSF